MSLNWDNRVLIDTGGNQVINWSSFTLPKIVTRKEKIKEFLESLYEESSRENI